MKLNPSPRKRRVLRALGWWGGGLCVLVVLLLAALQSGPARRFMVSRLTSILASRHIELRTSDLRYNLFRLSIDARDLQLRSARMSDLPTFVTIGHLQLDFSLTQLLSGRYVVQSGLAEDVDVHYIMDADGRDNLPRPPDRSEPPDPIDYLISSLSIVHGRVHYANVPQQVDVVLSLSLADLTGNAITDRHQFRFQSTDGLVRVRNQSAAIDRVGGVLDFGGDDLRLDGLQLEAIGSRAELAGRIRRFDAPELELRLHASVDAARAAPLLDVYDPVAGTIVIEATAGGTMSAPAIDAQVSGAKLRFRSLDAAQVEVRATYDASARQANVSSARLQSAWGSVAATAQVAIGGDDLSRMHAVFSGVDAAAVMRGLELPYAAYTRVKGQFDIQFPGLDYHEASGQASATLTPTRAAASRMAIPLGGRILARASGTTIVAELRQITTAGAEVSGRLQVADRRRLEGELHARVPDVAQPASAAEAFLGREQGTLRPAPVGGEAVIDARLGGTVDTPIVLANVAAPSLSIGTATGIAVGADLALTPATLTIARADAKWNGAKAGLRGTMGLADQRLDLVLDASAPDVQALHRAAGAALPVSGAVSAHGRISGTMTRPIAALMLRGADLVAFGESLGSLHAEAAVAGPAVTLSRLMIEKPQPEKLGRITAAGSYNLQRQSYAFELQSENVQLLALTLPGGQRVRGDMHLSGKGSGSATSPAGTMSLAVDSLEIDGLPTRSSDPKALSLPAPQLGRIVVAATAANQQATITASAERFNVDANGVIALSRPWPATFIVRANDLDLARLPFDLQPQLTGHLRATINATGDLVQPALGRATATIEALAGSWNGQPFSVTSAGELRYQDRRLDIERLQLTAADSSLDIIGELPLSERAGVGDVAVQARASVATLARLLPPDTKITGDGVVTVAGSLRGTLTSIDPDLLVTVENGALSHPRLEAGASNIQLRARVAAGAAEIERLSGSWGAATVDASGTIPLEILPPLPVEILRHGGPVTIRGSVRDLDPSAIPGAPAGLTGRVAADISASAARADLTAVEGLIEIPQLEIAFNRLTLGQQQPSRIRIGGGAASVDRLALSGSAGTVAASGTVGLVGERPLDLRVEGSLRADVVSALTRSVRTEGAAALTLSARGTVTAPELYGTLDLADITLASDDVNIAAVNVNAHVDLAGTRLQLTRLNGEINGGTLEASGSVTLGNGSISDVDLQIRATDVAYDAPLELRSLSDATIRATRRGDEFLVAGQLTIKEAGLTSDSSFDEGLFADRARRALNVTETRYPFLERVRFDIALRTITPAVIDNRLARGEIDADLRLVGTPYEPGLTGRLTVVEGGQVTLNARRYEVERGVITFVDQRRIIPSFDVVLNTQASNYDVRIAVTGSPGRTETSWTSEPPLPEPDIMSLVVTGRTLDAMRGEESEVARIQALSYLTGRVGSKFGGGIERATGLSEVRIEPVLIANETDPTARLTVGQNLTHKSKLVYSTNLADSNDQIWVVEYDLTRRFQMRGVREHEDDSYRFDFRHDLRFGGDPAPRREQRRRPTIVSLTVATDSAIEETELRKLFKLKQGDTYEYFAARNGLDRIEKRYLESGFLQSRIRLDRHVDNHKADLTLRVTSGPLVDVLFEGATPPSNIQEEVRRAWHRAVFDRQRGDDSVRVLREWLIADNHLRSLVEYDLDDVGQRRRVVFRIQPGLRYDTMRLAFEGASGIDPDHLNKIIEDQHLERQLFTDAEDVTSLLEGYYREQGFLSAEIDGPRFDFQGKSARVILTVREGPRFAVGNITVSGNTVYTSAEIAQTLPLEPGAPFLYAAAEHGIEQIRELYWRKGYNSTRSEYAVAADRDSVRVDIAFSIAEGPQSVVADIAVEGNHRTSEELVRGEVELSQSQPLDLSVLARSRRNLYNIGAFSIADIGPDNVEGDTPASAAATPDLRDDREGNRRPVHLKVSVREVQPVQLHYGVSYDTEGGLGGILDLSIHNSLGQARVAGVQARYDEVVREGRVYVSQPSRRSWPRKTTASVYIREDLNPPTQQTESFDISRKGASIQQEARFRSSYVWTYGYRYELATTLEPSLGSGVTETVRVTPLSITISRDVRDEVLDASRGTFLSQALAYSPSWLGSDRPYLKYYGQYFHYFSRAAAQKPFADEIPRPRLVFATGARVGLSRGLGGEVPTSEHFYAGGSTTLRGFEQNAVGPLGANNVPAGGNAVLVLNNELRMPLVRIIDGVLFADVGNVFPTVSDFSLTDLRQTAGIGIRLRTPWLLLRSDYGFVLDPRPGEARSRWYFSIGQAF